MRDSSPNVGDIIKANKMIWRLKACGNVWLRFEPIRGGAQSTRGVFADATRQDAPIGEEPKIASQGGRIAAEVGTASGEVRRTPCFNVLSWSSKKLAAQLCRSSFALNAVPQRRLLQRAFAGLKGQLRMQCGTRGLFQEVPVAMVGRGCDKVLFGHVFSIAHSATETRLEVDLFALKQVFRDLRDLGGLRRIDATGNSADSLTKSSGNPSRVPSEPEPVAPVSARMAFALDVQYVHSRRGDPRPRETTKLSRFLSGHRCAQVD